MKAINQYVFQIISFIFILFLITLSSCSKEKKGPNNTAIYGKVLDYYTLEPIPDVQIIMKDGFGATFYTGVSNLISITYSDDNGYYYIELKDHYYEATLGLVKDGYSSYKYIIDDYHIPQSFPAGIYPDYVIRLKPIENE